jgi:hypothetical protein
MSPTYHPWIEGFPPMCAKEREEKRMRTCDFLGRARRGSLKEKIETRQSAAEDAVKRNVTP